MRTFKNWGKNDAKFKNLSKFQAELKTKENTKRLDIQSSCWKLKTTGIKISQEYSTYRVPVCLCRTWPGFGSSVATVSFSAFPVPLSLSGEQGWVRRVSCPTLCAPRSLHLCPGLRGRSVPTGVHPRCAPSRFCCGLTRCWPWPCSAEVVSTPGHGSVVCLGQESVSCFCRGSRPLLEMDADSRVHDGILSLSGVQKVCSRHNRSLPLSGVRGLWTLHQTQRGFCFSSLLRIN